MLAKIIECFCPFVLCRQSAELNGVQRSVLLNCDFDKSNLVFGGPLRGSACLALRTAKDIFDQVVTKLVMREVSIAFGGADRSLDICG
jgi:hypothetical protein